MSRCIFSAAYVRSQSAATATSFGCLQRFDTPMRASCLRSCEQKTILRFDVRSIRQAYFLQYLLIQTFQLGNVATIEQKTRKICFLCAPCVHHLRPDTYSLFSALIRSFNGNKEPNNVVESVGAVVVGAASGLLPEDRAPFQRFDF